MAVEQLRTDRLAHDEHTAKIGVPFTRIDEYLAYYEEEETREITVRNTV
jgi:hypothetical protein